MTTSSNTIAARFKHTPAASAAFTLDLDLVLPGQGITVISGASGSGKTTLLRCLAGLERATDGSLTVNGSQWQSRNHFVPPHQRSLGYVFQEASLLPHMSAQQNLDYALKRSSTPATASFIEEIIQVMGIAHLLKQYPAELSGGERQRIAIARALLIQPRLMLLDEPLSALDDERKQDILPYLEQLKSHAGCPVVYVTHAKTEVARLADYVVTLENGQVTGQSTLREAALSPALLADGTLVLGTVVELEQHWHLMRVRFSGGDLWLRNEGHNTGDDVRIFIRASDISLALTCPADSSILNRIHTVILDISPDRDPAILRVKLQAGEQQMLARITRKSAAALNLACGMSPWAMIKSAAIMS